MRVTCNLSLALAACALTIARPTQATAQPTPDPLLGPAEDASAATTPHWLVDADARLSHFAYGAYAGPGNSDLSLVLTGTYRSDTFETEVALPIVYDLSTNGDATGGGIVGGDPSGGLFYARELHAGRLRVGGIVALPLAGTSYRVEQAHSNVGYAWSYDRAWLWLPGNLSILASIRLSNLERQRFGYATEFTFGYAIRLVNTVVGNALVGNLSQEIAYRSRAFRVGLRALLAKPSGDVKLSMLPFIGGDFGRGYFDVGYNIDVDNPFGLARQDGLWCVQLRSGARF